MEAERERAWESEARSAAFRRARWSPHGLCAGAHDRAHCQPRLRISKEAQGQSRGNSTFRPGKRVKSQSAVQRVAPCSMASAAKCASITNRSRTWPLASNLRRTSQWRSVGSSQNHRQPKPSARSISSQAHSMSANSGRMPVRKALTLNGFRSLLLCRRASSSPSRSISLTVSLNDRPDSFVSAFNLAATSSSSVRVVRTSRC